MTTTSTRPGDRASPAARRRSQPQRKSPTGARWVPYVFLAPAAAWLLVFQVVPLAHEVYLSFTRTSLVNPTQNEWVGLDNFRAVLESPDFRQTVLTTLLYVACCVVGTVGTGLGTALLLNGSYRGKGLARALVTIPWAAPGVAVALIATWMLNAQYGIVNRLLDLVGLAPPDGAILTSTTWAFPAILITTMWQLFPYNAVVLLSALQSVPQELVEAANVDGAGRLWTFRVATWPVIKPTVSLLALLNAIWAIRRFDLIWIATRGGPAGRTKTLVIDLYSNAFDLGNLGRAAAIGVVGVVISLIFVSASLLLSRRAERENS